METLVEDVPEIPTTEEKHKKEWHTLMRSTSLSNCPVEDMDICNTSRSLRNSTENLVTNTFRDTDSMKENEYYKRNVICTLYKITESPPLSRRNSSLVSISINNKRIRILILNILIQCLQST